MRLASTALVVALALGGSVTAAIAQPYGPPPPPPPGYVVAPPPPGWVGPHYFWHGRHWHHRRWYHHGWRYY